MALKAWEAMVAVQRDGKRVRRLAAIGRFSGKDGQVIECREGRIRYVGDSVSLPCIDPDYEPYELVEEPLTDEEIAQWCEQSAREYDGTTVSTPSTLRRLATMIRTRKRQP